MSPSVYLLHGFVGSTASWDAVIASWPGQPPRPVPLPGHHAPIARSWDENLALVAERIPRDAVVVGYSLGARVALGLLARDHVGAAVLIGVNPGLVDSEAIAARRAADAAWAAMLRKDGLQIFLDTWQAQTLFATQQRASVEARRARRRHRESLDPEALAVSLETMGLARMPDYRAALIARASRAHLIVGADDEAYLARAQALVAAAPALGLDEIEGSGHDPTLEQPTRLAQVASAAVARLVEASSA